MPAEFSFNGLEAHPIEEPVPEWCDRCQKSTLLRVRFLIVPNGGLHVARWCPECGWKRIGRASGEVTEAPVMTTDLSGLEEAMHEAGGGDAPSQRPELWQPGDPLPGQ